MANQIKGEFSDFILDENQTYLEKEIVHYYPRCDVRPHVLSKKCWCKPELDNDAMGEFYVHHSMDGREKYETGERKVH